jgi:hypothetical protein
MTGDKEALLLHTHTHTHIHTLRPGASNAVLGRPILSLPSVRWQDVWCPHQLSAVSCGDAGRWDPTSRAIDQNVIARRYRARKSSRPESARKASAVAYTPSPLVNSPFERPPLVDRRGRRSVFTLVCPARSRASIDGSGERTSNEQVSDAVVFPPRQVSVRVFPHPLGPLPLVPLSQPWQHGPQRGPASVVPLASRALGHAPAG